MVQASVGFHCPECARQFAQPRYDTQTVARMNRPWATIVIIAVNVAAYAAGELLKSRTFSFQDWGLLIGQGEYANGAPAGVAAGEWWRIFVGGFLHASPIHLGFNMLALWFIGGPLEKAMGRWRFVGLYLASLLAGSFAVLLFSPLAPTVGASGAIFGMFGVMFVYQRQLGINPWRSGVGGLILLNLLFTFTIPGISWAGHIGGLVGGALAALAVFALERQVPSEKAAFAFCAALSVALFAACIYVANQPLFL
jgi:membrane associated rhomboid family serine protease